MTHGKSNGQSQQTERFFLFFVFGKQLKLPRVPHTSAHIDRHCGRR